MSEDDRQEHEDREGHDAGNHDGLRRHDGHDAGNHDGLRRHEGHDAGNHDGLRKHEGHDAGNHDGLRRHEGHDTGNHEGSRRHEGHYGSNHDALPRRDEHEAINYSDRSQRLGTGSQAEVGFWRMRAESPLSPRAEEAMTRVIGCAMAVHKALGPGLFESIYARAMWIEMEAQGLPYEAERSLRVTYRGVEIPGQRST